MPEIAVEDPVCSACGAEVRPGTAYCYNCGEAVAPLDELEHVSEAGNAAAENNGTVPTPAESPLVKPDETVTQTVEERRPLKTAAEIRRRARAFERKPVEIVWEEHAKAPGILFVIVTVILALFAIAVVIAVVFIK